MVSLDWLDGYDLAAWSAVIIAPVIGSFLGVVIRRLPERRPVAWSRSRCDSCKAPLAARDLVPLLSWILARGRCRFCHDRLGWFYPLVELAALAIALLANLLDRDITVWLDCILGWWLLTLAWIDARHWILPDILTLPLILAGLLVTLFLDADNLMDRALGAALGYLSFRALAYLYRRVRGREGLGHGDAKLLAAAGAWVGVGALPQVILLAALAGLCAAIALRIAGFRLAISSALPFGPFLALATWVVWLLPAVRGYG